MPRIRQLSPGLINKIAAGEVIERPASVVKELMENAVDAHATRIDVAVEGGGVDLVRVVDNGCGIAAEDLPMAVASHATSKIATEDDLFSVRTLGFRGEALASIAEVSRLVLRSRTADAPSGAEITVSGGMISPTRPCGCPVGTAVEVRDLFFNTPVRRKFLRSPQTELGHVSEAFVRIALGAPHLYCTLRHNDRPIFELAAAGDWLERIRAVFGRDLAESLIWVESTDGKVRLSGYVAHPSQSRSNNRMQYLFLNGRSIRDRSLQHALAEAYRGLLMTGRYPIALLSLEMPPELVDVNVHPTKLEVRFQDSGRLYSQLLATLRSRFLAADLTTRVPVSAEGTAAHVSNMPGAGDAVSPHDEEAAGRVRQQLVEWAKGQVASWGPRLPSEIVKRESAPSDVPSSEQTAPAPDRRPLELTRLTARWEPLGPSREEPPPDLRPTTSGFQSPTFDLQSLTPRPRTEAPSPQALASSIKALQIHNRYLVAESEDGVMVIDQHALHERIIYEQLRQRILSGTMQTQNLLVPEPVDLAPAEAAVVLENRALLAQLGLRIEPFGGNTVLVVGFPAILANMRPGEVLRGLVDQLLAGAKLPDCRDLLDDLLHTIACKAAIKAGDRLTPEEVAALLEQRHLIDDSHHCPHGRPAALVFRREELDKHFKRT